MDENDQTRQPSTPNEAGVPTRAAAPDDGSGPTNGPNARTRLRDRAFTFRATLAVALAGIVLGAGAGTAITAVVTHDDHGQARYERFGDRGPRPGNGFGMPGQGGERNQPDQRFQVPPGTAPEEQEPSTAPDQQNSNS